MRVAVVTQDDPFYVAEFFSAFLGSYEAHKDIELTGVYILRAFNESKVSLIKRMLRFYGFKDFLRQGFRYLWRKASEFVGLPSYSIASICRRHGIFVDCVEDVNSEEFIERIKRDNIDVLISVAASKIFKKPLLEAPKWGCVNIHSAALPKYRGMMPNFWAMYHGDPKAGITIHTMDEALDKGKIILQGSVDILPQDTLEDLMIRSKRRGAELMWEALERINSKTVKLTEYKGKGSYFSFPTTQHVKELRSRGRRLV